MDDGQVVEGGSIDRWNFVGTWWFVLLTLNAVAGIAILENTWKKTSRFRNPNLELEKHFGPFHRDDALRWRKWMLYPGAMTLMIPRFILAAVIFLTWILTIKVLLLCRNTRVPLQGCRKFLINVVNYFFLRLFGVFAFFTWHTYYKMREDEVDYSEYLGTTEFLPTDSSIGGMMKDFYSRPYEHSSSQIRSRSGSDFISQGSELLDEADKLFLREPHFGEFPDSAQEE